MKRVLLGVAAAAALSSMGCVIEEIKAGDPCWASELSDQYCTGGSTALYCAWTGETGGTGIWTARNCDAECRTYGYTGGFCGAGTWGRRECVCTGVTYSAWTPTGSCTYEGDSYCWDRNTMYYCWGGLIYSYDCGTFCRSCDTNPDGCTRTYTDTFCAYDPTRAYPGYPPYPDDNCYCKFW